MPGARTFIAQPDDTLIRQRLLFQVTNRLLMKKPR